MKISAPRWLILGYGRFILAVSVPGLVQVASAQDSDSSWSFLRPVAQATRFGISPFGGYRFGGGIRDDNSGSRYFFADGPAYGVILDYTPTNNFGRFELLWSRQDSSLDFHGNYGLGTVATSIDAIQVGGDLEYGSERLRGYISAGLGATYFSSDGHGDATKFSWGIGGGMKAFLTKNIYLRADIHGFSALTAGDGGFIHANGETVASFSGFSLWQGQVSGGIGITF